MEKKKEKEYSNENQFYEGEFIDNKIKGRGFLTCQYNGKYRQFEICSNCSQHRNKLVSNENNNESNVNDKKG